MKQRNPSTPKTPSLIHADRIFRRKGDKQPSSRDRRRQTAASRCQAAGSHHPPFHAVSCHAFAMPLNVVFVVYAEALTLARALRCSNLRCFFRRRTLNRSKSVRLRRFSFWSLDLAQLLSFHLASISAFSQNFLTTPVRAARGSFSMTKGARRTSERLMACLGTTSLASAEGPSTRI